MKRKLKSLLLLLNEQPVKINIAANAKIANFSLLIYILLRTTNLSHLDYNHILSLIYDKTN